MDSIGKGIAVVGIWASVAVTAIWAGEAAMLVALFAMIATFFVATN
ncbi:hypothetical protein LCGC14_1143940 [marine sediment metagenome]|uniref:Uncharacterized protein n=1 Tax=marine sediment metagenome TaxID=412755 RepID=A0A0F9Q377_9ZZZZ